MLWFGLFFLYIDRCLYFMGTLLCLAGCFSMIILTPVLSVLYACILYICICTCSVQLSMFHMERRSRNMLIIMMLRPFFSNGLCGEIHRLERPKTADRQILVSCFSVLSHHHSRSRLTL